MFNLGIFVKFDNTLTETELIVKSKASQKSSYPRDTSSTECVDAVHLQTILQLSSDLASLQDRGDIGCKQW